MPPPTSRAVPPLAARRSGDRALPRPRSGLAACNSGSVTTLPRRPPPTRRSPSPSSTRRPDPSSPPARAPRSMTSAPTPPPTAHASMSGASTNGRRSRSPVRCGWARASSASLVGRLTRPDGSTQLSYGGHPLYTYIRDVKPGMVTGQAIDQDGGPWYVLGPAGNEIHTPVHRQRRRRTSGPFVMNWTTAVPQIERPPSRSTTQSLGRTNRRRAADSCGDDPPVPQGRRVIRLEPTAQQWRISRTDERPRQHAPSGR